MGRLSHDTTERESLLWNRRPKKAAVIRFSSLAYTPAMLALYRFSTMEMPVAGRTVPLEGTCEECASDVLLCAV